MSLFGKRVSFSNSVTIINDSRRNLNDITNNSNLSIPTSHYVIAQKNQKEKDNFETFKLIPDHLSKNSKSEKYQYQSSEPEQKRLNSKIQIDDFEKSFYDSNLLESKCPPENTNVNLWSKWRKNALPINDHVPDHFEIIFRKINY